MGTKTRIYDNIIIITGLSGAGKVLPLRVFEDQHYFVVDGLPAKHGIRHDRNDAETINEAF